MRCERERERERINRRTMNTYLRLHLADCSMNDYRARIIENTIGQCQVLLVLRAVRPQGVPVRRVQVRNVRKGLGPEREENR